MLDPYDRWNDLEALKEAERERSAAEIQVAMITALPFDDQLAWLRDSMFAQLGSVERDLARARRKLGKEIEGGI